MGLFDFFGSVGSAISSAFSSVASTVSSAASNVARAVSSAATSVSKTVTTGVGSVTRTISSSFGGAVHHVSRTVSSIAPSISRTAGGVYRHVYKAPSSVVEAVARAVGALPTPEQFRTIQTVARELGKKPEEVAKAIKQVYGTVSVSLSPEKIVQVIRPIRPKTILEPIKPVVHQIHQAAGHVVHQVHRTVSTIRPETVLSSVVAVTTPVSLAQAAKKIPEIRLPEIKIETKERPFTVRNPIDVIIEARNRAYEIGASEVVRGFQKGDIVKAGVGAGVFAGTAFADITLPLDLANVTNKVLTGRMNELDLEDWLWAGVDAATIAAGLLTAGAGYVAGRGIKAALKGAKVAGEAGKVAKIAEEVGKVGKIVSEVGEAGKVLKGGEEMGKFSGLFKGFEALKFEKGLRLPHFKVPDVKPKIPIELEAHFGKFRMPELPRFKIPEMPRFRVPELPKLPDVKFRLPEFKLPELPRFRKAPELPKLTRTEEAFKATKGIEAFEEAKIARFTEPMKGEIKTAGEVLEEAGKSAKLSREIEAVSKAGKFSKLKTSAIGAGAFLGGSALMYSLVKGRLQEAEEREKQYIEYIKQLEKELEKYRNILENGQIPVDEYLSYYLAYLQQMLDQLYKAYASGQMGYDEYINQLYDYINGYLEELNRAYEKGYLDLYDYIRYLEDYLNYINQLYSGGYIDDSAYQELYNQIMKELQDALNEYYAQYGEYPAGYEQYVEGGYFEPAYGEFFAPIEYAAQDLTRILDDVPVVGGVFKEARKHGLAFPAVAAFAGLTVAGGYYLFAKKKLHRKLAKKVGI